MSKRLSPNRAVNSTLATWSGSQQVRLAEFTTLLPMGNSLVECQV